MGIYNVYMWKWFYMTYFMQYINWIKLVLFYSNMCAYLNFNLCTYIWLYLYKYTCIHIYIYIYIYIYAFLHVHKSFNDSHFFGPFCVYRITTPNRHLKKQIQPIQPSRTDSMGPCWEPWLEVRGAPRIVNFVVDFNGKITITRGFNHQYQ